MLNKELKYVHDKSYLQRHPKLQPKMRAILLDWLLEVGCRKELDLVSVLFFYICAQLVHKNRKRRVICVFVQVSEVYNLHRQTAYLAQDYFDRFMLTQVDVSKDLLQLVGITALFIASKIEVSPTIVCTRLKRADCVFVQTPDASFKNLFKFFFLQEIYPPKICEFAYVTDGACDMWDIQRVELQILKVPVRLHVALSKLVPCTCLCVHVPVLLQALDWNLCPETPISWLKLYAQVEAQKDGENFLEPQFCQETYIQITQVPRLFFITINLRSVEMLERTCFTECK